MYMRVGLALVCALANELCASKPVLACALRFSLLVGPFFCLRMQHRAQNLLGGASDTCDLWWQFSSVGFNTFSGPFITEFFDLNISFRI